jgi:meso-butanediol dehydrogenase / (S,S)-butanediol dehydrogenase / diacetyl reductase
MSEVIFGASTGIALETIKYVLNNSGKDVLGISRQPIPKDLIKNKRVKWLQYEEEKEPEELADFIKMFISSNKIEVNSLILCAGILNVSPAITFKNHDLYNMFRVNCFMHIFITRAIVPKMLKNGGSIVAISSSAVENNSEGRSIYNASKSALESYMLTLGQEVGSKGVRVNIVRPGLTNTKLMNDSTPMEGKAIFLESSALKKISEPEDIANIIFFLISDLSKSITCASISAHGGARL